MNLPFHSSNFSEKSRDLRSSGVHEGERRHRSAISAQALAVCLGIAVLLAAIGGCSALRFVGLGGGAGAKRLKPAYPEQVGISPVTIRDMERRIDEAITNNATPGAVLVVAKDSRIIEEKAFGNRRTDPQNDPMTLDTIFDLASVSKIVGTATTSMLLIEDGRLHLDDRVADIIPEFAANDKGDVKVRDLITHRSGLKAYDSWKEAEKIRGDLTQADALIKKIAGLPKLYPTGEYTVYSCLNFLTLARVNETVAGESQNSILKRRVWDPLGMKDTTYLLTEEQRARCAPEFKNFEEGRRLGDTHDPLAYYYQSTPEHCPGNAGLFSTAHDLSIYCQMILNGGEYGGVRVFNPETIELMTSTQSILCGYDAKKKGSDGEPGRRALGWIVYQEPPYTHSAAPVDSFIGHTGYTGTYLWLDKNSKSFILLLSNSVYSKDPPQIHPYRKEVTGIYLEGLYGKI